MTTEEFIKRSKEKFPGLFTYEKTNVIHMDKPVIITSIEYGDFETTPHYHLRKTSKTGGCKFLADHVNRNLDTKTRLELHIKKAKSIFGDRFNYDKVEFENYKDNSTKVTVVCKDHGEFKVSFSDHLNLKKYSESGGCPLCSKMIRGNLEKRSNVFKQKATIKFEGRFDYSNSKIPGLSDLDIFEVRCIKHDLVFTTSAPDHLRFDSGGCPKCSEEISLKKRLERREKLYDKYLEKSKEIHNNFYDYSKIDKKLLLDDYSNIIICPKHGEFRQSMNRHRTGAGCPHCADLLKESKAAIMMKSIIFDDGESVEKEFIINTDYLKNKPYDLFIKRFNLLVEVQGDQHRQIKYGMTEEDLKKRIEIDKNKKEMSLLEGYNFLEVKSVNNLKLISKLITDLKSSTTIEIFESKIKKYDSDKVEYTKSGGNREHYENSEDIV